MTEASRSIVGGTCHVFHAFEVGYSIDIDQAAQRVSGAGRIALASSVRQCGSRSERFRRMHRRSLHRVSTPTLTRTAQVLL